MTFTSFQETFACPAVSLIASMSSSNRMLYPGGGVSWSVIVLPCIRICLFCARTKWLWEIWLFGCMPAKFPAMRFRALFWVWENWANAVLSLGICIVPRTPSVTSTFSTLHWGNSHSLLKRWVTSLSMFSWKSPAEQKLMIAEGVASDDTVYRYKIILEKVWYKNVYRHDHKEVTCSYDVRAYVDSAIDWYTCPSLPRYHLPMMAVA